MRSLISIKPAAHFLSNPAIDDAIRLLAKETKPVHVSTVVSIAAAEGLARSPGGIDSKSPQLEVHAGIVSNRRWSADIKR